MLRDAGFILLAFLGLYAIEAGYFSGMLFASKRIRGQNYRALPSQYFGDFLRVGNEYTVPYDRRSIIFNPPEDCVEGEKEVNLEGVPGVTVTEPNGIQTCTPTKDNRNWALLPWVKNSNFGLESYPGCADTDNTIITAESNPSFTGEGTAVDAQNVICQSYIPNSAVATN